MDLSIIIPVFNTDIECFKRCINSISFKKIKYEIIVVDDGSNYDFNQEYSRFINELKSKNIRIIKKENGGVSSARNIGIKESNGEYIMFVDSDDILFSIRMELDKLDKEYDVLLFDKSYVVDNKEYIKKELPFDSGEIEINDIFYQIIEHDRCHSPVAKLLKRSFLLQNKLRFDENMIQGEDALFNINIFNNKPSVYYISESIYGYYFDEVTSNNRWINKTEQVFNNYKYVLNAKEMLIELLPNTKRQELYSYLYKNFINYFFQYGIELSKFKNTKAYYTRVKPFLIDTLPSNIKMNFSTTIKKRIVFLNSKLVYNILYIIKKMYLKFIKKDWN